VESSQRATDWTVFFGTGEERVTFSKDWCVKLDWNKHLFHLNGDLGGVVTQSAQQGVRLKREK